MLIFQLYTNIIQKTIYFFSFIINESSIRLLPLHTKKDYPIDQQVSALWDNLSSEKIRNGDGSAYPTYTAAFFPYPYFNFPAVVL